MKRLFIVCILFFVSIFSAHSQDGEGYLPDQILKISLINPAIQYEVRLGRSSTLVAEAGFGFSFGYGGERIGWLYNYVSYLGANPRYYYNLKKRADHDKDTRYFSGNYISIYSQAFLFNFISSSNEPNQYLLGPTWGLQRNLGNNFYLNFQIGAGLSMDRYETNFTPLLGFNLGVRLN